MDRRHGAAAPSVGSLQTFEHGEVPDVAGRELGVDLFRSRCDHEVRKADRGSVAIPTATELAGATCDGLVERNPVQRSKELLRARTLSASETARDLDSRDFATDRNLTDSAYVAESSRVTAKDIDQNRGVEDDAHARRRRSISSCRLVSSARSRST